MLPAYAGMIPVRDGTIHLHLGAPRVCGDDPCFIQTFKGV